MTEKQVSGDGVPSGGTSTERGGGVVSAETAEALERLRTVIDQASQTVRELSETSRQWAQGTQQRTTGLRGQGERAMQTVCRQVGNNLIAGVAAAMAVGFIAGVLTRR